MDLSSLLLDNRLLIEMWGVLFGEQLVNIDRSTVELNLKFIKYFY